MNDDLINVRQLSKIIKLSVPTIYRHMKYGYPYKRGRGHRVDVDQIPGIFIGGKRYWYKSAAVELLRNRRHV